MTLRPSITRRGLFALALGLLAGRPARGAALHWRGGWLLRDGDR